MKFILSKTGKTKLNWTWNDRDKKPSKDGEVVRKRVDPFRHFYASDDR